MAAESSLCARSSSHHRGITEWPGMSGETLASTGCLAAGPEAAPCDAASPSPGPGGAPLGASRRALSRKARVVWAEATLSLGSALAKWNLAASKAWSTGTASTRWPPPRLLAKWSASKATVNPSGPGKTLLAMVSPGVRRSPSLWHRAKPSRTALTSPPAAGASDMPASASEMSASFAAFSPGPASTPVLSPIGAAASSCAASSSAACWAAFSAACWAAVTCGVTAWTAERAMAPKL
mmetsp:Transcript_412/g.913  ORF Transcript_412/g.913 Transcript_412/m.913 type:complete len:237 (-) Transcript_412:1068-1778(-)